MIELCAQRSANERPNNGHTENVMCAIIEGYRCVLLIIEAIYLFIMIVYMLIELLKVFWELI